MWFFYLVVLALAVYCYYAASSKKGPEPEPASLRDVEAPTAEAGRAIPVVFGTVIIKAPNVVWYGDLKVRAVKDRP